MAPRNLTPSERDRIFGPLTITGVSGRDTVTLEPMPPLVDVPWGLRDSVKVHALAESSLRLVAADLERAGLLRRATPIVGFQPRLVRTAGGGNRQTLSAHAYGAAVDVRFPELPQGQPTDELQAQIAPHFERHGWFWGNNFEEPDPHHFAFQGPSGAPSTPEPERPDEPPDEPGPEPMPTLDRAALFGVGLGALGLGALLVVAQGRGAQPKPRGRPRRSR